MLIQTKTAHRPAPGSPANYHLPGNSVTARLEAAAMKGAQRRPSSPLEKTGLPEGIHGASPTTTLEDYDETYSSFGPERNRGRVQLASEREAMRHAEHKLRLTKQIEALPRIGNLLTLDVRGNDIRVCLALNTNGGSVLTHVNAARSIIHCSSLEAK